MNELIKELEAQCWEPRKHPASQAAMGDKFNTAKFAELIVRECVEQIYPQWIKDHGHIEPTNLADAVMRVKEHFGVE